MERLTPETAERLHQTLSSFLAASRSVRLEVSPSSSIPQDFSVREVAVARSEEPGMLRISMGDKNVFYPVRADDFVPASWGEYYTCFEVRDNTVHLELTNTKSTLTHWLLFF